MTWTSPSFWLLGEELEGQGRSDNSAEKETLGEEDESEAESETNLEGEGSIIASPIAEVEATAIEGGERERSRAWLGL